MRYSKGEKIGNRFPIEVVSLIQKTLKELEDESSNFEKVNNTAKVDSLKEQMGYIKNFLPAMLNEDEISSIIEGLSDKSMPSVMRHFKTNYAGKCDMSIVSKLAKQCQG